MKLINFETWKYMLSGYLSYERTSKYIVQVTRLRGDLPIIKYFLMELYGKISRYFSVLSSVIDYEIRVTEGMEKDIVWKQQADGQYIPYDKIADVSMPHLARKQPPTRKVVKNNLYIVDTEKLQARQDRK